jgi:hypothetical protein
MFKLTVVVYQNTEHECKPDMIKCSNAIMFYTPEETFVLDVRVWGTLGTRIM